MKELKDMSLWELKEEVSPIIEREERECRQRRNKFLLSIGATKKKAEVELQ